MIKQHQLRVQQAEPPSSTQQFRTLFMGALMSPLAVLLFQVRTRAVYLSEPDRLLLFSA